MEAVFTTQQEAHEQQQVQQLQGQAQDDWWLPGHPGWAIWPADSDQFLRQVRHPACTGFREATSSETQCLHVQQHVAHEPEDGSVLL